MTDATSKLKVEIDSRPAQKGADDVIRQFDRIRKSARTVWDDFSKATAAGYKSSSNFIQKIKKEFKGLQGIAGSVGAAIKKAFSFGFLSTAIGSLGIYALLNAITDVGLATRKFVNVLSISVGSMSAASRELEHLKTLANDLGLVFKDSVIPYAKFFAASIRSIAPSDIRDIFKAFGEATVALQLNRQEVNGVFLALQQMSSKGKVAMEELRLQLAERIPGAMQMAADAMQMTIQELEDNIRKGLVSAAELLPGFAREMHETFGLAAELASKSVIGAFARMENAVFEFMSQLANGGYMDALAMASDQIADWLNGNKEAAAALGYEIGQIAQAVANWISSIKPEDIASGFNAVRETIGTIHQVFINIANSTFFKWLTGQLATDNPIDQLQRKITHLKQMYSAKTKGLFGAFTDSAGAANIAKQIRILEIGFDHLTSTTAIATRETEYNTVALVANERAMDRSASDQKVLTAHVNSFTEAVRAKRAILARTDAEELRSVQAQMRIIEEQVANYQELGLNITDISKFKSQYINLLDQEEKLVSSVAKVNKKAYDAEAKAAKAAIDAIEKENRLAFKRSKELVNLAAKYGSIEAKLILYKQSLAEVEVAMNAIGASEAEIMAARQQLWNEGPGQEAAEAAERAADEWKRTAETIESSLTDALMRGFESGSDFAKNFVDTMKNLFATLVLRPIIQAIVAPVAGAVTGMFSGSSGAGGTSGLGSIGSLFGGNSIGSGFVSAGNWLGETFGLGNFAGAAGPTQGGIFAGAGAIPNWQFGLAGLGGGFLGSAIGGDTGGMLGGLGGTAGLALGGPIGAIAGSALGGLVGSLFGDDKPAYDFNIGGPLGGAQFKYTNDIDDAGKARIKDILNQVDASLISILTQAQQEAVNEELANRGAGNLNLTNPLALAGLVTDRYADAFVAIDEAFSEAIRVANRSGVKNDGWGQERMIANVEAMVATWRILQDMSLNFTDVLDQSMLESIADTAGGMDALAEGASIFVTKFLSASHQLTELKSDLTAQFNDLGLDLPDSRDAFRDLVLGLDLTTESGQALYGQLMALVPAFDQIVDATQPLTDLMDSVDDQLASLTLSPFMNELRDTAKWLDESTRLAKQYGASQEQLARIQEVAARRTAEAIRNLKSEIAGLVGDLYGSVVDDQLSQLDSSMEMELNHISDLSDAQNDLYRAEMARYTTSLAMVEHIDDYIASLNQSSLSPLTPAERLAAARAEYGSTLSAARGGDEAAMADITSRANDLLRASQFFFASSQPYIADYDAVQRDLKSLAGAADLTQPVEPGDITTSGRLQSLESQRQSLINQQESENRQELAIELADKIGDLGLALDESVWDILAENGINIRELAEDFGLNLSVIDRDLVTGLFDLASALHVDLSELSDKLGLDISVLGDVIADQFTTLPDDIAIDLDPALSALRAAVTAADLNSAMSLLRASVEALPPEEQRLLSPYLQNIVSASTGVESAVTKSSNLSQTIATYIQATNNALYVIDGRLHSANLGIANTNSWQHNIYNAILAINDGLILANIREQNKSMGIPSFDTGSAYVPKDTVAQVHQGEMIIDPVSADILRRYGVDAPAANDPDSTAREVRALRSEVIALRTDLADQHSKTIDQRQSISTKQSSDIKDAINKPTVRPVRTNKVA